jgi:ribosome-associated protein
LATPAKKTSPKTRTRSTTSASSAVKKIDPVELLRKQVLAALDELKAKDVKEIDVRGKTSIADILVIASGTSTRHVKSLADEVVKFVKKAGMMPLGVEGQREAEWVLVDLGDVIVHVMLPRIREFYGLERLWTVGDEMPAAANAE